MTYIPAELRRLVFERANGCCEYCRIGESDRVINFAIDHVIAEKHGGQTDAENLCLSCYRCNSYKDSDIGSVDWDGERVFTPLYNPRMNFWNDHFRLVHATIVALTPIGRVTVNLLRLNEPQRLEERELLLRSGRYPCQARVG